MSDRRSDERPTHIPVSALPQTDRGATMDGPRDGRMAVRRVRRSRCRSRRDYVTASRHRMRAAVPESAMNWTGAPAAEPLAFRALPSLSVRRYRRVSEWRGFHPDTRGGTWARALAFREDQKLRAQHTCQQSMSSMNCRGCNRGVPFPHPSIEEIIEGMRRIT